jgi:hypothetical protein
MRRRWDTDNHSNSLQRNIRHADTRESMPVHPGSSRMWRLDCLTPQSHYTHDPTASYWQSCTRKHYDRQQVATLVGITLLHWWEWCSKHQVPLQEWSTNEEGEKDKVSLSRLGPMQSTTTNAFSTVLISPADGSWLWDPMAMKRPPTAMVPWQIVAYELCNNQLHLTRWAFWLGLMVDLGRAACCVEESTMASLGRH